MLLNKLNSVTCHKHLLFNYFLQRKCNKVKKQIKLCAPNRALLRFWGIYALENNIIKIRNNHPIITRVESTLKSKKRAHVTPKVKYGLAKEWLNSCLTAGSGYSSGRLYSNGWPSNYSAHCIPPSGRKQLCKSPSPLPKKKKFNTVWVKNPNTAYKDIVLNLKINLNIP